MSDKKKKRYYWLKLKENFFEEDTIEWLEEQPNGKEYCLFYLKLCLKSLKTEGILVRNVGNMMIPYDPESLAKLTNSSADTVKVAMDLFHKIGLIQIMDGGEIYLNQLNELVGSETESAIQKRLQRAKEDNVQKLSGKGRLELEKEIEKELDKDIEIEKETKKKNPPRHKYGEYKNVLLNDEQLEKLKEEFPNDWEQRIDRVSEYCELSGKTYKNYLATIRAWARKDTQTPKKQVRSYARQEQLPDWAKEPVDYSSNKPKVTDEDLRRFLEDVGDTEGF
ncbi:phage replisome organizer N-terminal domain-containing protein [Enterococcus gallinarum]|uniref:phage replisome organizer N-terminal domain-containing protein n=1 Tax=Enterococcus gallinarum TaxID=1353 RepID=UPI0020A632E3|nr:phage replisome organizer N-terminal domain-containing protein [Enterococcus gallinarum]MDT2687495.1 phage replisome organizer N-terminal domain-containing protein [Enterococcus gallinarum]NQE02963.1 DnaD domain protein [Enterococcus gallinarum]